MLAQRYRLKSRKLFDHTLRSQAGIKLCANRFFAVFGLPHTQAYLQEISDPAQAGPKFGIVISKKVHKLANRRNKIKRRLREAIRTQLLVRQAEKLSPFRCVVIIVRTGSLEASYRELNQALLTCFEKRSA